jgi:membrane-bound lytic murein transglycosylase A
MLYTGYYKPNIEASFTKTDEYKYPLYALPNDIIKVNLADFGIKTGGKIQGRIQNNKLIPYYTRREIDKGRMSFDVLLWTKSYLDNFFLQIQGSGNVQFMNGDKAYIAYAGNNGHKYTSIGKVLLDNKWMKKEDISLFSLKKWLKNNPYKATNILQQNARYIFFSLADEPSEGSLKMPLISERSLAVDPKYIPLGSMVFINTPLTARPNTYINKTLFAQDTGAAITGPDRADIFFGDTKEAEYRAAYQNSKGKLYLLALKKTAH